MEDRLNIYIIPAWYPQNDSDISSSFFREQAKALAERGHRVTVIHIEAISMKRMWRQPWHEKRIWQDGAVRTLFHKVIVPLPGKFAALQDLYISHLFFKVIQGQIKEDWAAGIGAPDLLHAHVCHSCAYYCLDAAKRLNLPLVVTEHYSGLLLGVATDREYARVRRTIMRSDAFCFVGSNFQRQICKRLGVDKTTYVIGNMIPSNFFGDTHKPTSTIFTFLSACHLKAHKNVDSVIRAFHDAFPGDTRLRLCIAGDGEILPQLKALAHELQEDSRIFFYGKYSRGEAKTLFTQSDVFVLVGKVETFGVVYVEAMASGLPCIGTKGQGAEDIISDDSGILVEYGKHDELVLAMRRIFQNSNSYVGKAIQDQCRERFSEDAVCAKIEAIYHSVKRNKRSIL